MKVHKSQSPLGVIFRVFASKGCVDIESVQRKAQSAYLRLEPHLTKDEIDRLSTARSHALDVGEGREEFDEVCQEIGKRLFDGFIKEIRVQRKRTHRNDGTIIGGKYDGKKDHDVTSWNPEK